MGLVQTEQARLDNFNRFRVYGARFRGESFSATASYGKSFLHDESGLPSISSILYGISEESNPHAKQSLNRHNFGSVGGSSRDL